MDTAAPIGAKRRGIHRWRLDIFLLLASPAIALLLVNLLLASPWSCHWLGELIQRHSAGLEARVGGASFTPWSGISINRLKILQPPPLRSAVKEPLLRIDTVRIAPVWNAWLRGRLEIQSITLDTPRIVLPVELISHLVTPGPPLQPSVAVTSAPSVVAVAPAAPPIANPPSHDPTQETAEPAAPLAKLPSVPTGWLHLKNASFAIVHAGSNHPLLEISETTGSIPVAGDPAQSVLKIGGISAVGNKLATDLPAALVWKFPELSLTPVNAEVAGYQVQFAARLAPLASGLPLQIEAALPRQAIEPIKIPFDGQASADGVTANARFRGLLLAPASWQGDFVARSTSPTVRAAGHEVKFDSANLVTILRGGVLSCIDARLISDELSLLGNATLLADGRLAGVTRLVAKPETIENIVHTVFPENSGPPAVTPLSSPQRAAFDLEAIGNISQIFLRLGKDGPVVNLHP